MSEFMRIGDILVAMGYDESYTSSDQKIAFSKYLRENQTPSERLMARILFHLGIQAEPQVVLMGWIVDFFDAANRTVIEVDGSIHQHKKQQDAERDEAMRRAGYRVIRIANDELPQMMANVYTLKRMESAA